VVTARQICGGTASEAELCGIQAGLQSQDWKRHRSRRL